LPETDTSFVPVDLPEPSDLNHSAPFSTMRGTFDRVSTLLISVGPW
jgi:hypothetical protein